MSKPRHFCQLDHTLAESKEGRLFVHPGTADVIDLSGVRVVNFSTDTVRQLYRGALRPGVLALFEGKANSLVELGDHTWHPGRIGRDSGYQFRLQNADLGVILLIKSFHVDAGQPGPHLKIEVSPHLIQSRTPQALQRLLDSLAGLVLTDVERNQCAVHVALDVQGWHPGDDFQAHLHCRSRRSTSVTGINSVDFNSESVVYGRGQSWSFGSAGGIQLAVYNKTLEAKAKDRLDYWRNVWSASGDYDESKPVYRIEFRFHHSIVDQFAQGSADPTTGEVINTTGYDELYPHLTGLWRYALDNFRYLYSPGYFDPFWTLIGGLSLCPGGSPKVEYRRYYKTSSGFSGKNVELLLGNFLSCAARMRLSGCQAWKAFTRLPFFQMLQDHYTDKGMKHWEFKQHFLKLMNERYIRYGKAV